MWGMPRKSDEDFFIFLFWCAPGLRGAQARWAIWAGRADALGETTPFAA
jgi:hypothetical protein